MMTWDWLTTLFEAMVPNEESTQKQQFAWRVRVGLVACGTFTAFVVSQMIEYGWLPALSSGFAQKSQLTHVSESLNEGQKTILLKIVDRDLFMLRVRHCAATSAGEKQLFWGQIEIQLADRLRIAGSAYPLPPCESLQ